MIGEGGGDGDWLTLGRVCLREYSWRMGGGDDGRGGIMALWIEWSAHWIVEMYDYNNSIMRVGRRTGKRALSILYSWLVSFLRTIPFLSTPLVSRWHARSISYLSVRISRLFIAQHIHLSRRSYLTLPVGIFLHCDHFAFFRLVCLHVTAPPHLVSPSPAVL